MRKSKSQVSVDLTIVLSAAMVIFLVVLITVSNRNEDLVFQRTKLYAKSICEKVAIDINTVFFAGDGTQKTVELPDSLKDNSHYLVNIYPTSHFVEVLWFYGNETKNYHCPIIFGNLECTLTNLVDDFNLSSDGCIEPSQDYNGCEEYCLNRDYDYGICRPHGVDNCRDHGEDPGKGNVHSFCRIGVNSVCCCGYF